jgi:hypothetical protein
VALIKLNSGQGLEVSPEKGHAIWQVLHSELEGTEEQQAFCTTVANVYLNRFRDDLPASYVKERQHIWASMDAGKSTFYVPETKWYDK